MAWTQIYAGMIPSATLWNQILGEIRSITVKKTLDENYSAIAIHDDTELFITLPGNTLFVGNLIMIYNCPAAADFKMQFAVPTGATGYWSPRARNLGAAADTVYQGALPIATQAQLEGPGGTDTLLLAVFEIQTSNPGTFKLQWAENTLSGTMTVKAGSMLTLRQVL